MIHPEFNTALAAALERMRPTNADRIRAMSDEELADVLLSGCDARECPIDNHPNDVFPADEVAEQCWKCWLDWLQSPAEGR